MVGFAHTRFIERIATFHYDPIGIQKPEGFPITPNSSLLTPHFQSNPLLDYIRLLE